METSKRATVYFDPDVHRALLLKAVATDRSLSEVVNEAVKLTLAEDAEDLEAFRARKDESSIGFEEFLKLLQKSGKL